MPAPLVLLFDLDGTLVRTGGAGVRAFERGFGEALGWPGALDGLSMAGRTDPGIAQAAALRRIGRELTETELGSVFAHYLACLPEELAATPGYRVLPGIREFLEAHARDPLTLLGLGTGNLEAGARLKLVRGGLEGYFTFGGYGSDARERPDVLRAAVRRAEARLGGRVPPERVVVIGDTPLDAAAGRAIGARTLCVATGPFTCAALAAGPADVVVPDFGERKAVDAALAAWR
jgi:phosphoglycolate phosphatase